MSANPFDTLGVSSDSTEEVIRLAWKEKLRQCHPDVGGTHEQSVLLNRALEDALRLQAERLQTNQVQTASRFKTREDSFSVFKGIQRDTSCFTVDVLPVDCWHALEIVAGQCGSVLVEEPPYLIEFTMHDTGIDELVAGWCCCELVPEAGATTVHVSVGGAQLTTRHIEQVRDLLVESLNDLDW